MEAPEAAALRWVEELAVVVRHLAEAVVPRRAVAAGEAPAEAEAQVPAAPPAESAASAAAACA